MFAATHFRAMARNNAWSNHRLLKACRELSLPQDAPYYDVSLGSDRRPSESDLDKAAMDTVWVKAYPQ